MEPQPTKPATKQPEQGQREKTDVPQIVVVDFGKRQTRKQVKRLRKADDSGGEHRQRPRRGRNGKIHLAADRDRGAGRNADAMAVRLI
jgi:hypothetical protein